MITDFIPQSSSVVNRRAFYAEVPLTVPGAGEWSFSGVLDFGSATGQTVLLLDALTAIVGADPSAWADCLVGVPNPTPERRGIRVSFGIGIPTGADPKFGDPIFCGEINRRFPCRQFLDPATSTQGAARLFGRVELLLSDSTLLPLTGLKVGLALDTYQIRDPKWIAKFTETGTGGRVPT